MNFKIERSDDVDLGIERLSIKMAEETIQAFKAKGHAHIFLSGGATSASLVKFYGQSLREKSRNYSRDKLLTLNIWFSDERFVKKDSNFRNDIKLISILREQNFGFTIKFHRFPSPQEIGKKSAIDFMDELLEETLGDSNFDIGSLSFAKDGHLASIFAINPYQESECNCLMTESSKFPKQRITFSIERLAKCNNLNISVFGKHKEVIFKNEITNPQSKISSLLFLNNSIPTSNLPSIFTDF